MTTLPQMGLNLPVRGAPGAGQWGDTDDANLAKLDAHRHITGEGTAIPTAGININADLTFSSLYAPINLHRITFASIVSLSSNNKSLFVSSADNELYWRSNAGANVKLTSGSALNVAAFTGGIGGDYTAVSAAVAFDDAGDRYTFKQNSGTGWARLASGDVRLFETGTSETVFVGLAAPSALAASYTVTMPLAAPAATTIVQMDSSGVLTASNTVANAATFSTSINTPSVTGTPNFTGAVTMASTLGVTGLITATAGVTAAVNQHVTVSGTGQFKHGTRTAQFNVAFSGTSTTWNNGTTADNTTIPITLLNGNRILAVRARIQDSVTGPTQMTIILKSRTDGSASTVATSAASAGSGAVQTISITGLTTTIASGTNYEVVFLRSAGAANVSSFWVEVDYDQP